MRLGAQSKSSVEQNWTTALVRIIDIRVAVPGCKLSLSSAPKTVFGRSGESPLLRGAESCGIEP